MVVEGVGRHIEEGLSPKEAALKAMDELTGPVVGIALVLSAVFVPTAFIPGITGRLYQQFAVTIAISVHPLRFQRAHSQSGSCGSFASPQRREQGRAGRFFAWFNRTFERATDDYVSVSGALIRKSAIAIVLLVAFVGAAAFFGSHVPSSFLPDEDQGYLFINLQLPNAASLQRTDRAARRCRKNTSGHSRGEIHHQRDRL